MTISEMHVWFRQYAQQMGMQNVRAILPEQIDNLINTSTLDIVDEVINRSVGTTNDRVITDNAKLANINALRTLYKVKTILKYEGSVSSFAYKPLTFTSEEIEDALYFVDFSVCYGDRLFSYYVHAKEYYSRAEEITNNGESIGSLTSDKLKEAYNTYKNAFLEVSSLYQDAEVSFPLTWSTTPDPANPDDGEVVTARGDATDAINLLSTAETYIKYTKLFPIRVIDDSYLADVLNDWILAPKLRTPVMVIYSANTDGVSQFEIYFGENSEISGIASERFIGKIRCSYIKKPVRVQYLADVGGTNVDSDLPEQLQIPMLKHAVDLYRVSIQGSLFAQQQNDQINSQEIARNNARPVNDGYQS